MQRTRMVVLCVLQYEFEQFNRVFDCNKHICLQKVKTPDF